MPATLTKKEALNQLVSECATMLENASYSDGLAVCTTPDLEAIERLVKAIKSHEMRRGYITESELQKIATA